MIEMRYVIYKFLVDYRLLERNLGGIVEERCSFLLVIVVCKCFFVVWFYGFLWVWGG